VESFHKRLGKIMWDKCGMARNEKGLKEAITEIQAIEEKNFGMMLEYLEKLMNLILN
jgi:succinate dehydrogenase/fumarate reductase flavoprotein subunit